ncbi:MAG: hypothetical protein K0R03_443 [Moraxellaceae bacterium]|jgi:hypothetical protein|nr:hypothetical protein [Moraxellaceae bacterium]
MRELSRLFLLYAGVLLLLLMISTPLRAELELITDDQALGEVTGEGLAILPQGTRIIFDSTAYLRSLPRGAPATGSGVAGAAGNAADLFWYGIAFSAADGNLNNRVGASAIASWGAEGNPWVLLATSPSHLLYDGSTANYPVLQYRAPSYLVGTDFTSASVMNLKYAFFGDIAVCNAGTPAYGSTTACGGLGVAGKLQSISVWDGFALHGSRYSIFQSTVDYGKYMGNAAVEFLPVTGTGAQSDGSFGAVWLNRINSNTNGVMRFGVGGSNGSVALPETVPLTFNASEGLWLTDLDINMPVGHLHYQPLVFDNDASGNLVIELARIPNNVNVYNYAYRNYGVTGVDPAALVSGSPGNPAPQTGADSTIAKMCTNATLDCTDATHGELRVADLEYRNNSAAVIEGSRGVAGTPASVAVEGVFLQHLKIRTLGL